MEMDYPKLSDRISGVDYRVGVIVSIRTPENVLMDTVACLQLEVEAMKCGTPGHQTLDRPTSPVRRKPVVFTSTRVPKFTGVTSWEHYRQVFDTIAQSNGWGDATVALQLCLPGG